MESITSNRYVNLLKNSGFKAVFGDENNKDVIVGVPVQEHRRDGGRRELEQGHILAALLQGL